MSFGRGKSYRDKVKEDIKSTHVLIYGKTTCQWTLRTKKLFELQQVAYKCIDLDLLPDGESIRSALEAETKGQSHTPYIFLNGQNMGSFDTLLTAHRTRLLSDMILNGSMALDQYKKNHPYDYDLIVIGGGSGGLACAKAAAQYSGIKVACLDYVKPSPIGTVWGLGGTCVNVGCIPKKLMHQAALLGKGVEDARKFGWQFGTEVIHSWTPMVAAIQDHIKSLNFKYKADLRSKSVKYINAIGEMVDEHRIKHYKLGGPESFSTAARIVIATGGRPRYPDIPGAKEFGITSDDLFSLPHSPGMTAVIGASYVALECAGFLAGLGLKTFCMVRSILLRGFDQQMADKIDNNMIKNKVTFMYSCIPLAIDLVSDGQPRVLRVRYKNMVTHKESSFECNTVLFAVGRDPDTRSLRLDKAGVKVDENGYIPTIYEQTNVPNIYAIGDVQKGKLQLTPLAIQTGRLLATRLFSGKPVYCNYFDVPTTVFTPLEYGCVGMTEDDAEMVYGKDNIEVYHSSFTPLEYTVAKRDSEECYLKLICDKGDNEKVVGVHITSPNAGEIIQGFAVAMKAKVKREHIEQTVGIHPTIAETFTTLSITKRSGAVLTTENC